MICYMHLACMEISLLARTLNDRQEIEYSRDCTSTL